MYLVPDGKGLSRYVTVNSNNNSETWIVKQMISYLSANKNSQLNTSTNCSDCLKRILSGEDKVCVFVHACVCVCVQGVWVSER